MKNLILILVLFFFHRCYGQYYPMLGKHGNEWFVKVSGTENSQTNQFVDCILHIYTEGDSVIGPKKFKKIFAKDDCKGLSYSPIGFVGLLYEDTSSRKIYYIAKGSQNTMLVYDFNLNSRDSVYLNFAPFGGGSYSPYGAKYYPTATDSYKVQISTKNMSYGLAKKITFNNSKYLCQGLDWIEGLGSLRSPLFFLNPLESIAGCCPSYDVNLTCVYKDGVQIYGNSTCQSAIEHESNIPYYIAGHITNSSIELTTTNILSGTLYLALFDLNGRKLFSHAIYHNNNDTHHTLELGLLPAKGIYMLVCTSYQFNTTIKLIKF